LAVDARVESADEVAEIVKARDALDLKTAILVTVPVPTDFEIKHDELEKILADALVLANKNNVAGKNITPFLLSQMSSLSGGRTLAANIALLKNNARVAAEIARALHS
jgi:pseudouridine-5'-phosphate glycosidase